MGLLLLALFILFPLISIVPNVLLYFIDSKKKGILYSILIGVSLGLVSYYFVPPSTYDLFRHHIKVSYMFGFSFEQLLNYIPKSGDELLPILIEYVAALFRNKDIIQLIVVSSGYSIILYLLYDYRKMIQLNNLLFIPLAIFVFFGFNVLYFISGLWFYLGVILFSLAIYMDYIKKSNKILCYIIYVFSLLFHNAIIFSFVLLLIYKLFKNKLSFKVVLLCIIVFFLSTDILAFINSFAHISFVDGIIRMSNDYLFSNNDYNYLYDGIIFVIEMSKLIVILFSIFMQRKSEKSKGVNGFIILLSICTLLMMTKSIVMIRFIMVIQFVGIVPLFDSFAKKNKYNTILLLVILALDLLYIYYFYHVLSYQYFGNIFGKFHYNFFSLLKK